MNFSEYAVLLMLELGKISIQRNKGLTGKDIIHMPAFPPAAAEAAL